MRTIDEVLEEHCDSLPGWSYARKEAVKRAMIEYAKMVIDRCADAADVKTESMWYSSECDDMYESTTIDKESILKVKNELQ